MNVKTIMTNQQSEEFVEDRLEQGNVQPVSGVIKKEGKVVARYGEAKKRHEERGMLDRLRSLFGGKG